MWCWLLVPSSWWGRSRKRSWKVNFSLPTTPTPPPRQDSPDPAMETTPTSPTRGAVKPHSLLYYLSYLRSLLFTNLLIYFYTAVCGSLSLFASLFDDTGRWQHAFARVWSWLILTTSGIRTRVEGVENLNPRKTAIYCANHQSAMDIPILFVNLPVQFRFVAKRSLFRMPFMGWHLKRSGHIPWTGNAQGKRSGAWTRQQKRSVLEALSCCFLKVTGAATERWGSSSPAAFTLLSRPACPSCL